MHPISDLVFLFLSSFLAATIFPAQSEAVLVGLSILGHYDKLLLLFIATTGNVLGSVFNWLLGYYFVKFKDRKWFPIKDSSLNKALKFYEKYGIWSLLFAWVPIVGDPLTLLAGIFRTNIFLFLLLVTIGKAVRYAILLALF